MTRTSARVSMGLPTTALMACTLVLAAGSPLDAQIESERVGYTNPRDGTRLNAWLSVPAGRGPHPGVVLLSVAGTDPVVRRLVAEGYAVLAPELRGFVMVEPLLQATFEDLAGDVAAAVSYLGSIAAVDGGALTVLAQGDNTPYAMGFAAESRTPVPLILMAPPALPGREQFRIEQRWIAENQGAGPAELDALDRYTDQIADIVLSARGSADRAHRLQALRARSRVDLPRNASFPEDGRQTHFFASRFWHDRMAFDPVATLGRVGSPVLVLIGTEDPNTPMEAYLSNIQRGLAASGTGDGVVRRVPGRTRHVFSEAALDEIVTWLHAWLVQRRASSALR